MNNIKNALEFIGFLYTTLNNFMQCYRLDDCTKFLFYLVP